MVWDTRSLKPRSVASDALCIEMIVEVVLLAGRVVILTQAETARVLEVTAFEAERLVGRGTVRICPNVDSFTKLPEVSQLATVAAVGVVAELPKYAVPVKVPVLLLASEPL